MDGLERLKRNSKRLRLVFAVLLVSLPILTGFFWVFVGTGNEVLSRNLPVEVDSNIPVTSLVVGFLVSLIPTGVVMYALFLLYKLFGLYYNGKVFAKENVACYRSLGWAIIYYALADFVSNILLGIVLTFHRGQGQRLLIISLSSTEIFVLIAGLCILSINWVMDEARKLKEEQELFL